MSRTAVESLSEPLLGSTVGCSYGSPLLTLSELLGDGVLHHLGVLLIQAVLVGAGLAGVLLQVDLAKAGNHMKWLTS